MTASHTSEGGNREDAAEATAHPQPVKAPINSTQQYSSSGTPASAHHFGSSLESSASQYNHQHNRQLSHPDDDDSFQHQQRSSRKTCRHRNHRRNRSPSPLSGSDHWPSYQRTRDHHHHRHHRFPLAASSSVADLDALADLIDKRSGWCEDRRVSDEQIEEACRGKSRAVKSKLKEYYEELNYILDGWRLADVVVESQFPAEVMRRFGTIEEVQQAWGRSAQLHHHHALDGAMSPRFGRIDERKASLQTKAAQALGLGGFWFSGGNDSDHQGGSATPTKSRFPSEEESGFDSDSEPEPNEVGPGPRRGTASGSTSEAQPLLAKKKKSRDLQRGRRGGKSTYGTDDKRQSTTDTNAENSAEGPVIAAVVREVTPAGRNPTAVESASAAGLSIPVTKPSSNSGSANEEEDRDRLTDLPGGKRERERLALLSAVPGWEEAEKGEERAVQFAININLIINVLLLAGKAIAVLSSSSVSLLASLVDSALDLLSTLIIFAASKAVAFKSSESYFKYPRGKKNFEPLGVVIFSVLMIASFCQVLVESIERLSQVMKGGKNAEAGSNELPLIGVAFMVLTIGIKAVMWVMYRKSTSSGVRAVAQDSQNDVVFNVFSLTFPFFGARLGWPALDPIGGIVLSLYIISEWLSTLISTTTKLSGARASTADLARVLYLISRFKSVKSISACEMYYAGDETVVEADVILPIDMPFTASHHLGEVICYCVETMPNVERAYIHLDYNSGGQPAHISARG